MARNDGRKKVAAGQDVQWEFQAGLDLANGATYNLVIKVPWGHLGKR